MKTSRLLLLLIAILGTGMFQKASAQRHPVARAAAVYHADKVHARRVIRRTAVIILEAQKDVRDGKVYTGDLARAVAHQRFARRLYLNGEFLRAMRQSRRARWFAMQAIKANKPSDNISDNYDPEDQKIMNQSPASSDADLDNDLQKDSPNYSTNDQDFTNAALDDIDLTDIQ